MEFGFKRLRKKVKDDKIKVTCSLCQMHRLHFRQEMCRSAPEKLRSYVYCV